MTTSNCPTPEKRGRYPDRAAAAAAAARIRIDQRGPALEPYPCPCGVYHLTGHTDLGGKIAAALRGDRRARD